MPTPAPGGRPFVDYGEPRCLTYTVMDQLTIEKDPRMMGPSRHHSVSDFDGMRTPSASSVQGFYANQRFGPRQSEADQMMQAKRRMAAQREKELRNYHQEQQYNRSKRIG